MSDENITGTAQLETELDRAIAQARYWTREAALLNGFALDDVSRELLSAVDRLDAARKRLGEARKRGGR